MSVKHIYKSLLAVRSRRELAELLHSNIVYNKEGVIALNKPYGLRNGLEFEDPNDRKFKNVNEFNFSLSEALPLLAEMLEVPQLKVARSPEKFASGVTLLNVDNNAGIRISQGVSHPASPAVFTYQAVCYGVPIQISNEGKLGLKSQEINGNERSVVLTTDYKRKTILKRKVKQIFYRHKVLSKNSNQEVSLVEVTTNRIMWYYVPLYLATRLLTPVIGDQIFGSKVKHVFGKPILVPPMNLTGFHPQKLPNDLYRKLEFREEDSELIPNHLHLSSITLYHFHKQEPKHLTISAPAPPYFQWTCSKLRLWDEPTDSPRLEITA